MTCNVLNLLSLPSRIAFLIVAALMAACGGDGGFGPGLGADIQAPAISIAFPTSTDTYSTTASVVSIAGVSADDVGVTEVAWTSSRGGGGTAEGTTSWSISGIALQLGANVVTVSARDAAGNRKTASLKVVKTVVDIVPPTISITAPGTSGTYSTTSSIIAISGVAADEIGVTQVAWSNSRGGQGVAVGTMSWSVSGIALLVGDNVITITARDIAGNSSVATLTVKSAAPGGSDKVPPAISITAPDNSGFYSTTGSFAEIAGFATDNLGVTQVTWSNSRGGGGIANGVSSWNFRASPLQPGSNVITVTAHDAASNLSTASINVVYSVTGTGSALTSRPNDGSGYWPDFSNTGYAHTPANVAGLGLDAYPGHLADYTSGMSDSKPLIVTLPDNSVVSYTRFLASKVYIYGDNLTFVGCLFEGKNPNDNLVQIYAASNVAFRYSTFKPSFYVTPPGNDGTVSSSRSPPGTPFDKSWQLATTMRTAVAVMDHNDIWGNAGMEIVTGYPGRPSVWTNNYIHDASDTANDVYHHDGIGPQSEGDGGPMLIDHNTLASIGNTNGLALQGSGVYDNIAFTNNYVSGYGYAISIGVVDNATNITFSGNVFSAELRQLYGPLYGNFWGGSARGSLWRNNFYQVRAGDDNKSYSPADNRRYWWPTDNISHAVDYNY
ncbi:hypothetical protein QTH90_27215 [Variovorax sp. J2P1-59]|uniref:hypothetical protein n=1 Tax=Variovorax flavidus TaxID=3053501 RepID=UPI0025783A1A|nr:hypothetical protein [Variovorax sp. J2P1-59]MDM0078127.1 hypothetical protein [Variovorax sp. J2P1-59]